jgi:hypothetical protein
MNETNDARREPSAAAMRAESTRLFRRARRRPMWVLWLGAFVTFGAAAMAARKPVRQRATVVLRMTEEARSQSQLSWTDKALRGYVNEVAFSNTALLNLIKQHKMFRSQAREFNAADALVQLRERIAVDVAQNHAIALLAPGDRPRSAHVRISYDDGNPPRAFAVAMDLGQLVVATGRGQQRRDAEVALKRASEEEAAARAALDQLRAEAASSVRLASRGQSGPSDIPGLTQALRAARSRLDRAEADRVAANLRLDAPTGALDIELLGYAPSPPPWPRARKLAVVIGLTLLLSLPMAALLVGAFDRRIYAAEDVRRLGIPCLGHVGVGELAPSEGQPGMALGS